MAKGHCTCKAPSLWGVSEAECERQAIRVMREQPAGGHIFNMDGAGADGGATPRFAAYGPRCKGSEGFLVKY